MDFTYSPRSQELQNELDDFMRTDVIPSEEEYFAEIASHGPHHHPEIMEELKARARSRGLWNLFLPDPDLGANLTNVDYAPLAEISARSPLGPEAINCSAPDTGNMEILNDFGTEEQKRLYLQPLLDGEIRSCFAMTEPDVASSDATNIAGSIRRDGDSYVVTGRKWWTTGALSPRAAFAIFMGKTDPSAARHKQQSMIIVPLDAPGVTIVRNLTLFGYADQPGHAEIEFDNVRVPKENMLGEEGSGFAIAQARLGPGRVHHCMRALGMAEEALRLLINRVDNRVAFGEPIIDKGVVREWIAESRLEIEQTRLLVLKTAWLMDVAGNREALTEIAAIKVAAPRTALSVIDRAIQAFGGAGVSQDTPLARMYALMRTLRIADGPDEVHLRTVARQEIRRHRAAEATA